MTGYLLMQQKDRSLPQLEGGENLLHAPGLHSQSRPKLVLPRQQRLLIPAAPAPAHIRPRLSITYDTLPARNPLLVTEWGDRTLLTVRDGLTCGQLESVHLRLLPEHLRPALAAVFGVEDPDRDRWWDPDSPADWDTILLLESLGRLAPWPHGQ